MLKIVAVLGGVAAVCVLSAGIAAADDTEGGHCEYGDASVNLSPSCDTSSGGAGRVDPELPGDFLDDAETLTRIPGPIFQLPR